MTRYANTDTLCWHRHAMLTQIRYADPDTLCRYISLLDNAYSMNSCCYLVFYCLPSSYYCCTVSTPLISSCLSSVPWAYHTLCMGWDWRRGHCQFIISIILYIYLWFCDTWNAMISFEYILLHILHTTLVLVLLTQTPNVTLANLPGFVWSGPHGGCAVTLTLYSDLPWSWI